MANKVIISCAITGSIHTPSMSPHLPVTPEQIATSAIGAAEAGAAILHLHARDPANGRPSSDPAVYKQFLPRIKQATSAVVNITTGGSMLMSVDQRLEGPQMAAPEMCSLNMGSMNFGLFPLLQRFKDWTHPWEPEMLAATEDAIFKNTFKDIGHILKVMGEKHGTRFEHECYDVGHLYNLAHFVDKGALKPPFFVQMIFGILGGIGADMRNLMFMKETADKLFGKDYRWSVLGAGKNQMPFCTQAVMLGGNVRVGLEDSLYIGRGKLATSNAEQVLKIRTIIEELGHEIATPAEARAMLGLKGGDKVGILIDVLRRIPRQDFVEGRWRNGQGVSWNIATQGDDADFDWRLALARIDGDVDFSVYGPVDRVFTLLEGGGLSLAFAGGAVVEVDQPHVPHAFACDLHLHCRVTGKAPALALNLFTARGRWSADVEIVALAGGTAIPLPGNAAVLLALEGGCDVSHGGEWVHLREGDAAVVQGQGALTTNCRAGLLYVGRLTQLA